MSHVFNNSGQQDWFTPAYILDAAREVMGAIDLDPASSAEANRVVRAGCYFDKASDGLTMLWYGRVFLNPPYARGLVNKFVDKLLDSPLVDQAIVLLNNGTETAWGQKMLSAADCICYPNHRIKYVDGAGDKTGNPLQGQMICGYKVDPLFFQMGFESIGTVHRVMKA